MDLQDLKKFVSSELCAPLVQSSTVLKEFQFSSSWLVGSRSDKK